MNECADPHTNQDVWIYPAYRLANLLKGILQSLFSGKVRRPDVDAPRRLELLNVLKPESAEDCAAGDARTSPTLT